MTNAQRPEDYMGRNAVDPQGSKIGSVGQVYVDDQTGQPDWVTINTGLFGTKENFAPLHGATFDGDNLVLPYDKAVVKDAPNVADASHLDEDEQQSLYTYYERYLGGTGGGTRTGNVTENVTDQRRTEGYDTSGRTTDDAMTRSEEQLNVGKQRVEAGRARLRKYIVTEQQTTTVPVSHEEVRIEREPITDANRGDALDGPDISEEEHEVILHAEQPVVSKETVPVERVRMGTETVSEQQQVTGEVRKEQIEVEDDVNTRGSRDDLDPRDR